MAVPPPAAFRAGLADLPVRERARFVAALYRARGWTAEVSTDDGDTAPVVTLSRDGDRRRLLIHEPGWLPAPLSLPVGVPDDVDAVVTPGTDRPRGVPSEVTVIDGDALYERAVHGIDATARERLFEAFLDREVVEGPGAPPEGPAGGRSRSRSRSRSRWRTLHAVLGVVALGLVAAAVVGLPAADPGTQRAVDTDLGAGTGMGDDGGDGVGTPTPFVGTDAGTDTGDDATPDAAETAATEPPPPDAYPPGVNESGIVDLIALMTAHARGLNTRHYRAVLTYTEYDDFGRIGRRELVATVRQPGRARTSVTAQGAGFGIADPVPRMELFADGATVYYRQQTPNGTRYSVERGEVPLARFAAFGQPYLVDSLDVDSSRLTGSAVRDGQRLFRISVRGDANPATEAVSGMLLVDSRGVVRSFRRSYTSNQSDDVRAEVTLRYEFENVVVEPPPWLTEARVLLADSSVAYTRFSTTVTPVNATDDGNGTTGSDAVARAID